MTATGSAQVVRDETSGPDASVQPSGPDYEITEDTGDVAGSSLFYNFSDFRFGNSETVSFFSGATIANILSRVTGGRASMLDGMLAATAMMYLLNPAGLIFGPNATLSVNGSFYASTADYIEFIDGLRFKAEPMDGQVLSAMDPNSFGFLSENPGGNIIVDGVTLSVADSTVEDVAGGLRDLAHAPLTEQGGDIAMAEAGASSHGHDCVRDKGLRRFSFLPVYPASCSSCLRPWRLFASGPCSCPSDHLYLPWHVSLIAVRARAGLPGGGRFEMRTGPFYVQGGPAGAWNCP